MKLAKNIFNVLFFRDRNSFDSMRMNCFGRYLVNAFVVATGLFFFRRAFQISEPLESDNHDQSRCIFVVFKGGGYGLILPGIGDEKSGDIIIETSVSKKQLSFSISRLRLVMTNLGLVLQQLSSLCSRFGPRVCFDNGLFLSAGLDLGNNIALYSKKESVRAFRVERIHPGLLFGLQLAGIRVIGFHLARRTWRLNRQSDTTVFPSVQYQTGSGNGLIARSYARRYRPNFRIRLPSDFLGNALGIVLVPLGQNDIVENVESRYFKSCINGAIEHIIKDKIRVVVLKGRTDNDALLALSVIKPRLRKVLFSNGVSLFVESKFLELQKMVSLAGRGNFYFYGQGSSLSNLLNGSFKQNKSYFRSNRFYPKNNWHQFGRKG